MHFLSCVLLPLGGIHTNYISTITPVGPELVFSLIRVINVWNKLPVPAVDLTTLPSFKRTIDCDDLSELATNRPIHFTDYVTVLARALLCFYSILLFLFLFFLTLSSVGILAAITAYYYALCVFGNVSKQTCILRAAVSACTSLAVRLIRYTSYCYVTRFMGKKYTYIGPHQGRIQGGREIRPCTCIQYDGMKTSCSTPLKSQNFTLTDCHFTNHVVFLLSGEKFILI